MLRAKAGSAAALAALCVVVAAAPAHAAKSCEAPRGDWERATPAEEGMDAAKLQDAMDYGTSQLGFAVRVYRRGCLVAEDREAALNRTQTYESWSMAKSVAALIFGRAMTLGLISPDDPVGRAVPGGRQGARRDHDARPAHETSGLQWNGLRDYNIFTMPDRVRDALTLDDRPPARHVLRVRPEPGRAARRGDRARGRRGRPGVQLAARALRPARHPGRRAGAGTATSAGNVGGFCGVNMRPDDFGRLGELMRRGGVWRGRRLLSQRFVREAVTPSPTNGCYAWLIWVNAARAVRRPDDHRAAGRRTSRDFPDLPADMYRFSGPLRPARDGVPDAGPASSCARGQDRGLVFAGGSDWEHELYAADPGLDHRPEDRAARPAPPTGPPQQNADYGFQTALREPTSTPRAGQQDPLPAAGPGRARAARLRLGRPARAEPTGPCSARIACPPRWTGPRRASARARATLTGARRALAYRLAPGHNRAAALPPHEPHA